MAVSINLKNYTDKSGKKALQLKCNHNGKRFVKSIGISVKPSDWDSRNLRIKGAIPSVANKLSKIRDNMFTSWEQYESGAFTWEELERRLTQSETSNDVLSFVQNVYSSGVTQATQQSYINVVKAYRLIMELDNVTFKHFNYSNINQAISRWKAKNLSPSSINSYITHMSSIVNEAQRRGLVSERFIYHRNYRQKIRTRVIDTATPELFIEGIENIKGIYDFQALALWMLQFTMRGMYTSDLAKMHLHSLVNSNKLDKKRYVKYKRSKSGESMNILYSCEPTEKLILALQNSFYITHKGRPDLLPDRTNPLQLLIYNFDDARIHKNTWDVYSKRCSKLLMPMKNARKTFESYALKLRVSQEIRYKLTGHVDQTIKKHYQNWEWKELSDQIDEAHIEGLEAFNSKELVNELFMRIYEVSEEVSENTLLSLNLSN